MLAENEIGCRGTTRTCIYGFRDRRPTFRRPGNGGGLRVPPLSGHWPPHALAPRPLASRVNPPRLVRPLGIAPRSADYQSAALLLSYGRKMADGARSAEKAQPRTKEGGVGRVPAMRADRRTKWRKERNSNPQPLTNRSWKTGFLPNRGYTPGRDAAQPLRASPHNDQLMCNAHWSQQVSVPYYGYAFMF